MKAIANRIHVTVGRSEKPPSIQPGALPDSLIVTVGDGPTAITFSGDTDTVRDFFRRLADAVADHLDTALTSERRETGLAGIAGARAAMVTVPDYENEPF